MGAFFRTSPLMEREGLSGEKLFEGIKSQLGKKFDHEALGTEGDEAAKISQMPVILDGTGWEAASFIDGQQGVYVAIMEKVTP